jgi:hypothetical protein
MKDAPHRLVQHLPLFPRQPAAVSQQEDAAAGESRLFALVAIPKAGAVLGGGLNPQKTFLDSCP